MGSCPDRLVTFHSNRSCCMFFHMISTPFASLVLASSFALPVDDTCATAQNFHITAGGVSILPSREVSDADPVDHYRSTVQPGHEARIEVEFLHADGDVNYRLWNSDCTTVLASSLSTTDNEELTWINTGLLPVEVVSEVFLNGSGIVDYDIRGRMELVDCMIEDEWEPNDSCAAPRVMPYTSYAFAQNRTLQQGDDDYYEFTIPPYTAYDVYMGYDLADGPIGMELFDGGCANLSQSFTGSSSYQAVLDNGTATPQVHVLRVFIEDTTACHAYTFNLRGYPGINFCTSGPNSTGSAAKMYAYGSASVSENSLVFDAAFVPSKVFGIFYYGTGQGSLPFGNGVRCVTGSIVRSPVITSFKGSFFWEIDLGAYSSGPNGITPGSLYHFQCWFRDTPAGGAGFDLSDGLSVQFLP